MTRDEDEAREDRIYREALADAYGPEEQAIGWYYYLERKIQFPFEARCIAERAISPLAEGETVRVVGMPDLDVCTCEMIVCIERTDREFGVPLIQLEPVTASSDTGEAIADWHYWFGDGARLC